MLGIEEMPTSCQTSLRSVFVNPGRNAITYMFIEVIEHLIHLNGVAIGGVRVPK